MVNGIPNKWTIGFLSPGILDWHLCAKHGQCRKIEPHHVNDLTTGMFNGHDRGLVD